MAFLRKDICLAQSLLKNVLQHGQYLFVLENLSLKCNFPSYALNGVMSSDKSVELLVIHFVQTLFVRWLLE